MKTTSIGSGGMGRLFGSILAKSVKEVLLIDICKGHVAAINSQGLTIESAGITRKVTVTSSTTAGIET